VLFTANNYKSAASERIEAAKLLQKSDRFALATYIAGRAVESICIGYLVKNFVGDNVEHTCGHDLSCLYKCSDIGVVIPTDLAEAFGEAFSEVRSRWSNDHRFRSEATFKRFLKDQHKDRGIKGKYEKENCRIVVEAAELIVSVGVKQWTI